MTCASRAAITRCGRVLVAMAFGDRTESLPLARWQRACFACLFICAPSASQEIDTALYQSDRPAFSLLDQIDSPAERKAMSLILVARKPSERLDAAERFLSRHPASWHLSRVLALASRASLQAGAFAMALEYGEQSLRLFPENPLVLVPMAAMLHASDRPDAAAEKARNALRSLNRFARPADIPVPAWQALESELREVASLVLRGAGAEAAGKPAPRLSLSDLSAVPAASDRPDAAQPTRDRMLARRAIRPSTRIGRKQAWPACFAPTIPRT